METSSDDNLPGNPGINNLSYVGMMLENMKNMLISLVSNIDAWRDINSQKYTYNLIFFFLYIKYKLIKVIISF